MILDCIQLVTQFIESLTSVTEFKQKLKELFPMYVHYQIMFFSFCSFIFVSHNFLLYHLTIFILRCLEFWIQNFSLRQIPHSMHISLILFYFSFISLFVSFCFLLLPLFFRHYWLRRRCKISILLCDHLPLNSLLLVNDNISLVSFLFILCLCKSYTYFFYLNEQSWNVDSNAIQMMSSIMKLGNNNNNRDTHFKFVFERWFYLCSLLCNDMFWNQMFSFNRNITDTMLI
jgi:hypothetical protein